MKRICGLLVGLVLLVNVSAALAAPSLPVSPAVMTEAYLSDNDAIKIAVRELADRSARTVDGLCSHVIKAGLVTLDSGAAVWSKLQTDRNSAFRTHGSITPVSDVYAVARYDSDAQVFGVALMNDSGELTGSCNVPAPGITSYDSETVFDWNGELWLQAAADNGSRWDAHFQKLGEEFAVEQSN